MTEILLTVYRVWVFDLSEFLLFTTCRAVM